MNSSSIWFIIISVSIVSILPRILPVAVLSRFDFPAQLKKWLSFVAPAVLGSLTALYILAPDGYIDLSINNNFIWSFIPTLLVAVRTRSLLYSLLVGMATMALLYNFF
ncbi:MAG: AzlD domain-containing protein [Peptococcaceae bacterium]|nr:AzlD domain-containing protein [Peptococcaceae bacterium]